MKKKLNNVLIAAAVALGSISVVSTADARHCTWVHSHWERGVWVKGHLVCDERKHCKWGADHKGPQGEWIRGHEAC